MTNYMPNDPMKKGIKGSSDNKMFPKNKNNTEYKLENIRNISMHNPNRESNYKPDTKKNLPNKNKLSPQLKPQLHNNNKINIDITKTNHNNNNRKDSLPPFRDQSRASNITNNTKPPKFPEKTLNPDRNIKNNLSGRNNNAFITNLQLRKTSARNKDSTNHQPDMKTFNNAKQIEILSLSRGETPIHNDYSATKSIRNKIDYKIYPTVGDNKNLKADERYLKSNLNNNHTKIDNQPYLNQYHDNDLLKYNNSLIYKCENCQNLISQNEKNYFNSNNINENENMKLQMRKFESEIENLKCKIIESDNRNNYIENEMEKLSRQNNEKEKILKSKINEQESEMQKVKSEIGYLKSDNEKLQSKFNHLLNQLETMKSQINKLEIEKENTKSKIIQSDQHKNVVSRIETFPEQIKSSKVELMKNSNKEKSEKNDDNFVGNLNQRTPAIKQTLLDNPKQTRLKLNTETIPSKVIPSSYPNEKLSKPIGFENPKGYCFLNCVVQQFYSCRDFRNELIEYHNTSQIADLNADEKNLFISNFCKLMDEIKKRNEAKIKEILMNIQEFFKYSSSGDDVHKCFMNILTIVSDVTEKRYIKRSASNPITPRHSFDRYRSQHEGFVFDLFYGQMAIKLVCFKCDCEINKRFQLFKSIPLPVPKSKEMIPLEKVIQNYLKESPVDTNDKMNCQCPGGSKSLYSITEFTHMPSYLFIYLNRGSYFENDDKNNTFINCNEFLTFPTGKSSTKYRLISVIDHIGDNYGGHYYAKSCFESDQWWLLNDSFVNLIEDKKSIVTKQAIVFLFKKY